MAWTHLQKTLPEAGVDGVLCVDLPPEEAGAYKAALDRHDICTIFLTAPTTTNERLELISKYCTGIRLLRFSTGCNRGARSAGAGFTRCGRTYRNAYG